MSDKVVIVTGANCGLGFEVSKYLCRDGYDVILACRSQDRGNQAVAHIKAEMPNTKVTFMQLDLADMASVREFVDKFHSTGKNLDILINNAGLAVNKDDVQRKLTKDNFELTMGINHLGHFLLTNLLLDDLKKRVSEGNNARVVVVASSLHDSKKKVFGKTVTNMSLDNLMLDKEGTYNSSQAYKDSKLANVLFTYELARRLQGTGVTVNCLCPGFIPQTGLVRDQSAVTIAMVRYILKPIFWAKQLTRTVQDGGESIYDLATNEKLKDVGGKYFMDMKETESSEETYNTDLQKGLWDLSARYCHLEGYDPITIATELQ